jgi:histidine ammonia-lyase
VKEGLALINGTQFMGALAAKAVLQAENLARHADIIFSLTFEALNGVKNAFHPMIHEIRNHEG